MKKEQITVALKLDDTKSFALTFNKDDKVFCEVDSDEHYYEYELNIHDVCKFVGELIIAYFKTHSKGMFSGNK